MKWLLGQKIDGVVSIPALIEEYPINPIKDVPPVVGPNQGPVSRAVPGQGPSVPKKINSEVFFTAGASSDLKRKTLSAPQLCHPAARFFQRKWLP